MSNTFEYQEEETIISIPKAVLISSQIISVLGVKVGDNISKLEAILCKQGIKYSYEEDSVDIPSKLIKIDPSFVFVLSDEAARFNLEVLSDNGSTISSFFFSTINGSFFYPQIQSVAELTELFSRNRYAAAKNQKMNEGRCIRQDFYTHQNAARIERRDDCVILEIMSKTRFEDLVLKRHEKDSIKNKLIYTLYIFLVLGYPIGHLLSYKRALSMMDVTQFFIDVFGSWLIISFILAIAAGIWIFIFKEGKKDRADQLGCLLYIIIPVAAFVVLSKACRSSKPASTPVRNNMYTPANKSVVDDKDFDGVYICTGPQSRRYHRTSHCRGLNGCSDDIEEVDLSTAEKQGKTPCGICY